MACNPSAPCVCCKSACCCSRQGSAMGYECCQAHCDGCEQAHGEGTAPGENCDSESVEGCNSPSMVARLPLGFCCEATTDECLDRTTECECLRENGDYINPCSGTSVPDSGEDWGWTNEPDCENPNLPCCPCGNICCLGPGDVCCDPAATPAVCCRGALGQTCCDGICCDSGEVCCEGVCCPPGQVCVGGVCQEGCEENGDCQRYYFNCYGTVYGPYDGGTNCAAAAAAICPGDPTPACYTNELDERYCCDGVCQDEPCSGGLSLTGVPRFASNRAKKGSRRWRKLRAKLAALPRPWHGPGSALKCFLSLMGINASPTCGCNKKAKEMDSRGCLWSLRHAGEIAAFMKAEADKRELPYPPRRARLLIYAAVAVAAITYPARPRKDTDK